MSKYRVKAYFMHEHEQDAAQQAAQDSVIEDCVWTAGYVIGVVDEKDIPALTRQGLVITLIEKLDTKGIKAGSMGIMGLAPIHSSLAGAVTPGGRPVPVARQKQQSREKVLSSDKRNPEFYVVRFHGPLTEERLDELKKVRIEPLERLTRNKYTIRLEPAQVKTLSELPFVDRIRLYTEADTCPNDRAFAENARPVRKISKPRWARRTSIYAVRLHRAADMPVVLEWLEKNKRKVLSKTKTTLRVGLIEHSKTMRGLVELPEVATVEMADTPRLFDSFARRILRLEAPGHPTFGLDGEGEIIAIADTGIDISHEDFKNRILGTSAWGRPGKIDDPEGHGTHVAGCAAGDGAASNGDVKGAAPKAQIFFQSILDKNGGLGGLPDDLGQLFKEAYNKGARIHNNSWGAFAFARYSTTSLDVDRFVEANPDMLVVIAAGNDGNGVPRQPGTTMNAAKGFVDWPCVAAPATAKNGLTVGASRNSRKEHGYSQLTWKDAWSDRYPHSPIAKQTISGDATCLAAFSSRGPSDDHRIKPDVVAPGTDIAAAKSKDAPLYKFWGAYPKSGKYAFMGGTSMAAPYVAGCAALVREWYRTKGNWPTPSAALIKATLINGTERIKGTDSIAELNGDPNFHQGFGRIDLANSIPNAISPNLKLVFDDTWKQPGRTFTRTGQPFRYRIRVNAALPLRICLAWTDPPARALQNSLVVLADDSGTTKWIGNSGAASLLKISGASVDPNNNSQVIRIDQPVAGDYTIAVTASMLLKPPQSFAIVVTGDLDSTLQPI